MKASPKPELTISDMMAAGRSEVHVGFTETRRAKLAPVSTARSGPERSHASQPPSQSLSPSLVQCPHLPNSVLGSMSGAQALYFDGDLGLAFDDNDDSGKECSVRGCHRVLSADAQMKMCEECRGRHRVYATTKRQRRKLEKEAVTSAMASENGPGSWQSPAAEVRAQN